MQFTSCKRTDAAQVYRAFLDKKKPGMYEKMNIFK